MSQHNISTVAHLIAEPVRSVILITLTDGYARSAGALAEAAGVTAQTASSHLAKLLDGGLLKVESKGRHRYYSLAGPHVPRALESLACVGPVSQAWRTTPNRSAQALRFARCCYDHLAGQIGVTVTQGMVSRGYIAPRNEYEYDLTPNGHLWLQQLGLEFGGPFANQASHAHRCLDWTERQYHIAGPLGAHLMNAFCTWGWMRRGQETRVVTITEIGWGALRQHLGIEHTAVVNGQAQSDAPHVSEFRGVA
ncbi:ArsR/SmtB family transcription factor [Paraburkholderia hospita]|uniref:ArsR/SmtB family transcription factor n=1 Tax=Paraburkholderia hospita TaxID=169430 RepID=UPI000B343C95|nr:helix-turn-helix transcriptional regulator [Paraburkholderia hospita]OUL67850.1 transcriptional regulator [Paraburkholderia hospita]